MSTSLPFDFFAGFARRLTAPRVAARHALGPVPLTRLETVCYAGLVAALTALLGGVLMHHRSFVLGRVASEEAERQRNPEWMGDLICEDDRVIGVSIQRVFDCARMQRPVPRALPGDHRVLDGALAAAQGASRGAPVPLDPEPDEVGTVVLQRPATWQAGDR